MSTIKTAIEIDVNASSNAQQSVKTFKQQLKELKLEAQQAVMQFGEFSPEALKAQQAVANLDDKMQDFNDRVKALNPDKFSKVLTVTQGITQGFQAAQGALALFGADSEDLQKQLVKVQGAMALAQGLEGLGKVQQQFSAIASTIGKQVVQAFSTLKGAIISTGIGALVVGLGLLITYWDDIKEALTGVSAEQTKVNNAMRDAVASQQGNISKIQAYAKLVNDNNISLKERQTALKELNKLGIEGSEVDFNSSKSLALLNKQISDSIVLIQQRAKAQALEKIIAEETEKIYKLKNQTVEESMPWYQSLIANNTLLNSLSTKQRLSNDEGSKSQKLLNTATKEYNELLGSLNKKQTDVAQTAETLNKKKSDNNELLKAQRAYLEEQWKLYTDYLDKEYISKKSAKEKELFDLKKQFDAEYYNINATYQSRLVSEEKYRNQLSAINKKYDKLAKDDADKKRQDEVNAAFASVSAISTYKRDKYYADKKKEEEDRKQSQKDAISGTQDTLLAISALNEAFASKTEEGQKQAFELDKSLKYASTVLSTIEGVQNAFTTANKSPLTAILPAYPFIQATAAALFGVAQLKKISDTKFTSSNTSITPSSGGSTQVQPPTLRASSINMNEGLTQDRKVYVTEGDIRKTIKRVSTNQQVSVVE